MAGMEITGPHEETPGWPLSMEGRKREAPLVGCCFFFVFFFFFKKQFLRGIELATEGNKDAATFLLEPSFLLLHRRAPDEPWRHTELCVHGAAASPGRDLFPQGGGQCLPPPKLRGSLNLEERSRSHMITGTRGHLGGSW